MVSIVPTNFASPLSGNETIRAFGVSANGMPSGEDFYLTTSQIASLAASETNFVSTNITTVGNGTLTASALTGSQIVRSGPTSNFSDATDTAANIIAAFPGGLFPGSNSVLIKNATAFTQTITAGANVTLPVTVIVPPFSVANYIITQPTSASAVTFTHIDTTPISIGAITTAPSLTSLVTVGAGTITAASFTSGFTARSGAQSATAFTDTTDTAANIIAACASLVGKIGASFVYYYANTTNAPATITGGTNVTVSGITVVQANSTAAYLVTYTAANTLTMAGLGVTNNPILGTFTANGSTPVTVANTAVSPGSQILVTLKTVGGTVGTSGPNVRTITPGTGFTIAGISLDTSVYNYAILG